MRRVILSLVGVSLVLFVAVEASSGDDAATDVIDAHLQELWDEHGVAPAEPAGDAEFLRRASLDLNGVIPRASHVRQFLADPDPHKRTRLIDELLESPRYANHMAATWHRRILPDGAPLARSREADGLYKWLRERFAANLRYDNLAGGLLLATGGDELGPALFYQTNDLAPEKLAASTAKLFLGATLDCAQCHDHPFSDWTQRDFWGFAAFFAQVEAPSGRRMNVSTRLVDVDHGDVVLPETAEIVPPKYPRGAVAEDDDYQTRRQQLTLWLASRDNRLFARAGVNWAWSHLFGQPLVDSVETEPTAFDHRWTMLDLLAAGFVESGFDLRELLRGMANARAYRLQVGDAESGTHRFTHMLAKPLTPEQLYDSFAILSPRAVRADQPAVRSEFVAAMRTPPGEPTEYLASTLQALAGMNGVTTAALVSPDQSQLIAALSAPFMDPADQVETLFLAVLGRHPDRRETAALTQLLQQTTDDQERRRVLSDLLWAMVNSTEFTFNR